MVNFENGTRTPEQSQIDWETIEPTLLDTLQLDTQTDAVLIGQIKDYLNKETQLPIDPKETFLPLKLIADPQRGFDKSGLQEFLTSVPRTPYTQLQSLSAVLDDMYTQYQADIQEAQVKNLSAVFPEKELLNQAVQTVTAAIPNFDGNLTSEQKVFIKEKYDALVNRQSNASKEVFVERSVSFGAVLDQAFAPSAPETQVGSGKEGEKKKETGLDGSKRKEFMGKTAVSYSKDIKALLKGTAYASLSDAAYIQLAQGLLVSYLPTVNRSLSQEGSLDEKERMTMTDIAELLKVSPLDEKNELVDATPGEIKATLLTYLEQTDNDKLSRQGTAEAFGSHMQVDQVVDGMTTFKMYFNQGRPATRVDKMFKPLKKLGDWMSNAMQGVGNVLDKLYQEYGPQLKEMLDMVKETFGFLGFGDNRDTSSFDEKIQSFIIETKGTMKPHEAKMTESLASVMQTTHQKAGYSLDLYDDAQLAGTVYTSIFKNNNLNDQLKSTPKYKNFLRAYKTDDVQQLMQQHVVQAIDGKPTEGTPARSPEKLDPAEVTAWIQRMATSRKGKLNGAIVISSPQRYFEMMSAYLLTGNESAALKLGLTEKETKVVEGAPLAASMREYKENRCFLELPADAKNIGYRFMGETGYALYDPTVGITRKSFDPTEKVELVAMKESASGGMEGIPGTNKELNLQRDTDWEHMTYTTVQDKDGQKVIPAHGITGVLLTTTRTPPKKYEYVVVNKTTTTQPTSGTPGAKAYDGSQEIALPEEKVLYMRHTPSDLLSTEGWHMIP